MAHAHENDAEHKVWSMMKDIGICMLATRDGDGLRSRPVAAYTEEDAGVIYVMTDVRAHKDDEVAANPQVNLAFATPGSNSYVSLSGTAAVVNDRAKIKDLWNTWSKPWWEGPDDPNIRLLRIQPAKAEYWDGPNKIVAGLIMAFNAVTGGKQADLGKNKKVAM
jgi:general stress protein 26